MSGTTFQDDLAAEELEDGRNVGGCQRTDLRLDRLRHLLRKIKYLFEFFL